MPKVRFTVAHDMPQLAYLVRIDPSGVDIVHGPSVALHDSAVSDGIWSAPFASGPPDTDHTFLAGTTTRVTQDGVRLSAPPNPTDRLFMAEVGTTVLASNSLPFILTALDDGLDPSILTYRSRFRATGVSLRRAPRTFRTKRGRTVRVLWDEIAHVGTDRAVTVQQRPAEPAFTSFEDYTGHLSDVVSALLRNARSQERPLSFEPLVALSTGYDSCATAAVLRSLDVRSAVTMLRRSTNAEGGALLDYPGEIAAQLDMDLIEVERDTWRGRTDLPDAEIAAASTDFIDMPLLALEPHLAGRLLFVGHAGDAAWTKGHFRAYHGDIVRGDTCGQGLSEHRLRVGYAVCAIPYIGHTAQPSLHMIANSSEMAPWSIGGRYDRPIPRRIVEEAGVERRLFGYRKFSGGALVGSTQQRILSDDRDQLLRDLKVFMTHDGADSYADFLENVGHTGGSKQRLLRRANWLYGKLDALNYRVGRRLASVGIRSLVPPRVMAVIASRASVFSDLTAWFPHWGAAILGDRYSAALRRCEHQADHTPGPTDVSRTGISGHGGHEGVA